MILILQAVPAVTDRVAFLSKGLLFNQKLIKTSRREAPDCGAKRRIRAPRARSARGASQLCVSKKSFCFFWIRACTTKRECSPRGRCGFGGVCFSTYPDFHVALFSHIKGTQNKRKHKHTHTRHTHRDCDYAGQWRSFLQFMYCSCINYYIVILATTFSCYIS